jgi:hypothetical protein
MNYEVGEGGATTTQNEGEKFKPRNIRKTRTKWEEEGVSRGDAENAEKNI